MEGPVNKRDTNDLENTQTRNIKSSFNSSIRKALARSSSTFTKSQGEATQSKGYKLNLSPRQRVEEDLKRNVSS